MSSPTAYIDIRVCDDNFHQVELSLGKGVMGEIVGGSYKAADCDQNIAVVKKVLEIAGYTVEERSTLRKPLSGFKMRCTHKLIRIIYRHKSTRWPNEVSSIDTRCDDCGEERRFDLVDFESRFTPDHSREEGWKTVR